MSTATLTDVHADIEQFDPEWLVRRTIRVTLITPDVAQMLLDRNTNNRREKRAAIARYARDMRAGRWDADASDIKVSRTGVLLDGQNRLHACIEADTAFPTLLRTGLADTTRDHVDQGVRRTLADSMNMAGVAYPQNVAAAINLRSRYETRMARFAGRLAQNDTMGNLTADEALEYIRKHPLVPLMARDALRMAQVAPAIPPSVWVAFLSMAAEASEKEAHRFAELFVSGESNGTGDPLVALVRYAALQQQHKVGNPGNRGRVTAEKHLLALILAWNAWRTDEKLDRIYVRETDLLVPAT